MKHLYSLLFIVLCFSACAPKFSELKVTKRNYPKPFEFELVDNVNASKGELFVRAEQAISLAFGSAQSLIDIQDKEAGKLILKMSFDPDNSTSKISSSEKVTYTMIIDVKDGKYRCRMIDFYHRGGIYKSGEFSAAMQAYGSLDEEVHYVKSPTTSKMIEDQSYFLLKNKVMDHSQTLLAYIKKAMQTPDKDF